MTKILLVCTDGNLSGAPVHCLNIIFLLSSDQVTFDIVFGNEGKAAQIARELGAKVHIEKNLTSKLSMLLFCKHLINLKKIVRLGNYDIIHGHSTIPGLSTRLISKFSKTRCIFTVHGWGWRGFSSFKEFVLKVVERIAKYIFGCTWIFVCDAVRKEGQEVLGYFTDYRVIHNFVIPDIVNKNLGKRSFIGKSKNLQITMIARVDRSKDHVTLLKAFNQINSGARLNLVGNGTDRPSFKELCLKHCPKNFKKIKFWGEILYATDVLQESDIIVISSNFEALPNVVMEALYLNKYIISSRVGGVHEVVAEGYNSFFFNVGDYVELARGINDYSESKPAMLPNDKSYRLDRKNIFIENMRWVYQL